MKKNNQVVSYLAYFISNDASVIDFQNLYSIFCFGEIAQDVRIIINSCTVIVDVEKDIH